MADRGILFSAPMVRALLAERKRQTRRLHKPRFGMGEPVNLATASPEQHSGKRDDPESWGWPYAEDGVGHVTLGWAEFWPYTKGDRLWVREAWRTIRTLDRFLPRDLPHGTRIWYEADGDNCDAHGRLRPGMFMPRWASRLTLTVTDVRVERLQAISEADAEAEGCVWDSADGHDVWYVPGANLPRHTATARESYQLLWNTLHTKPGERWEDDPWIVAVSFDVRAGNIDAEVSHG